MKITEIDWTDGKKYDSSGVTYVVIDRDLYLLSDREKDITKKLALKHIVALDFTEIIDWSKVEVDTQILVRTKSDSHWYRGYFSHIDSDGYFRIFNNWGTSWSTNNEVDSFKWQEATLWVNPTK